MIVLSLGSNIGLRESYLYQAEELLSQRLGPVVLRSQIYESEAWGLTDQPAFLNSVLVFQSSLPVFSVFSYCRGIETHLGRTRYQKWGPRTLDIDVLYYDDHICRLASLHLPHPGIANRRFVLIPLNEVLPSFIDPVSKYTVTELLKNCKDAGMVLPWPRKDQSLKS